MEILLATWNPPAWKLRCVCEHEFSYRLPGSGLKGYSVMCPSCSRVFSLMEIDKMAKKKAAKKGTKKATKKAPKTKVKKKVAKGTGKKSTIYDELAEEEGDYTSGGRYFRCENGKKHRIRFVPFTDSDGNERVFIKDKTHWNVRPEEENSSVPCEETHGEECRICAIREDVEASVWTDRQTGIKPQTNFLANMILRGSSGEPDKQTIGRFCTTVRNAVAKQCDPEGILGAHTRGDPLNIRKGYDFHIRRKDPPQGKKGFTKYDVEPAPRPNPVTRTGKLEEEPVNLLTRLRHVESEVYDDIVAALTTDD